ncbi:uncharacterized protein LOC109839069 [Asparagus officinalis]|uniref:uncharacterized protein LOC109839069 n=1 Tax=Asparagus officinalis TaxID=4686 RepID=UPI00098E3D6C|nr:uncharacterized protein LOC109839069 [Asparagus officinalis]
MASGKFLGFVVTANGIRLDPDKVKAIQELPPRRNLKELRGLQGRLAYIRRFISNLSGKCQPFSKLMKKGVSFMWDEACQKAEAKEALKEAHDGICGAHQPGPKLWDRLCRLGYYWPNMVQDAVTYAKRFHAYQIHANYMHRPPEHLHPSTTLWPFETWGMDIVGSVRSPSSKGHHFILAITGYFSKWAEAIPLREVKTSDVVKFLKHHIVYRIKNLALTAYNPAANGQAEAFNKTIVRILTKVRYCTFKEGDLVLTVLCPMVLNSKKKGKFEPKWKGLFVVETIYSNGAYHLITQNDDKLMMPINGKFLKKYYP